MTENTNQQLQRSRDSGASSVDHVVGELSDDGLQGQGQESPPRNRRSRLLEILAGIFALYSIAVISGLTQALGLFFSTAQHRALSLVVAIILVLAAAPKERDGAKPWNSRWRTLRDLVLLVFGVIGAGYVALFYEDKIIPYSAQGYVDGVGVFLTLLLAMSLLWCARKMTGVVLPILIVLITAASYWQEYLPGFLGGPGFDVEQLASAVYVGTNGIFGTPLGVATSIIIAFLIFGALLTGCGAGQWMIDMANAVAGSSSGGPAKASVVASGLFGSLAGSPSANVATTGTVTIPLMKRNGYSPAFAGGIEAAASTGGMVLPPVMGAVAFIMAEFLGIPYAAVLKAALVPALLYFFILFMSVHFSAKRLGLKGLPKAQLPAFWPTFLAGWRFMLPVGSLVGLIVFAEVDPEVAALLSIPPIILASFCTRDKHLWLTPKTVWRCLVEAVYAWRIIAIVTAAVGLILGSITLSGLGIKVSGFVVDLGGGSLLLTLLLVGLASLILGMGLDVTPLYMTLVVLTAPALMELGLSPTQAHLFVIFWGLASFITPPVGNAIYVASSISGSTIWRTGGAAMRVGIGVFLVPIAFALNPSLMLEGSASAIFLAVAGATVAAVLLAASLQGYGLWRMNLVQSLLLGCAAVVPLIAGPGWYPLAIALVLLVFALHWMDVQKAKRQQRRRVSA